MCISTAFYRKNIFSVSFRKYLKKKQQQKNNLITLIIKMYILFVCAINTSTACASSVFLSSCRNKIFNQSVQVVSLGYFLILYGKKISTKF